MSTVTNPANDIRKQAHQGSVAAIIQVLNQELSDLGVRTRAVYDGGLLQLLCEADSSVQLDQETLPDRIKEILELLAPRGVRRVNINSRIVREQQLLWLDEISREPEKLLWYKEVNLVRPNFLKTIMEDVKDSMSNRSDQIGGPSARQQREKKQFWRGIIGGMGAATALLLLGWGVFSLMNKPSETTSTTSNLAKPPEAKPPEAKPLEVKPLEVKPPEAKLTDSPEAFPTAVRLAEEGVALGSKAQTPADWQTIADKWGKASDLMAQVPPSDKNYTIAQDRTNRYKNNQAAALTKAK
ncbi:MAG: hypothetical protein LH631_09420 [Alkalinema sp. CAN_BIN05]|nr:hypothetical protein [Alkalinema sp. CAN_BIN05]